MRQGGGYEQLEMAELEAEIAELQSELHPQGARGGGERSTAAQPPTTPPTTKPTIGAVVPPNPNANPICPSAITASR